MDAEPNLFLSWSGQRAQTLAQAFNAWVKLVLDIRPWISTTGIEAGQFWFDEIRKTLDVCKGGVIFLTHENINKPWLTFEAGALVGRKLRVFPVLLDGGVSSLATHPLAQFNMVLANQEGFWRLVDSLRKLVPEVIQDDATIRKRFEMFWPEMQATLEQLQTTDGSPPDVTPQEQQLSILKTLSATIPYIIAQYRDLQRLREAVDAIRDPLVADVIPSYLKRQDLVRALVKGMVSPDVLKAQYAPDRAAEYQQDAGDDEEALP